MKSLLELSEEHRQMFNDISDKDMCAIETFLQHHEGNTYYFRSAVKLHDIVNNLTFKAIGVGITHKGTLSAIIDEYYSIDLMQFDYLSINRVLMQIGIETEQKVG